jgi:hypothetical protein
MDGWMGMDGWMNGCMDDGWMYGWMDKCMCGDGKMDGWWDG